MQRLPSRVSKRKSNLNVKKVPTDFKIEKSTAKVNCESHLCEASASITFSKKISKYLCKNFLFNFKLLLVIFLFKRLPITH